MATLTYTAYQTRKLIKYGGIGIIAFTVLWTGTVAAIGAYRAAHPPYVPPDMKFGVLPKIVFPEKKFVPKTFTAQLANDSLPKFSDQAKVYLITRPDSTFLALEEDTKTAASLGFMEKPNQLSSGVYEFQNTNLNQKLTMNVLSGNFQFKYPYESDQLLLNPPAMPSKEESTNLAKSYLQSANKYPADLDKGEKKVSFWKITFEGLRSVSSLSDANIVRVDFFRQNLESNYKIVASESNRASVSVLVSGAQADSKKIVEVNYNYTNIDREIFSTYPIKTAEEAWNDLKSGNYWPVSDPSGTSVAIRNMYLAYFEPVTLTNYLEPVFVFEGDGKFVAYVPAVVNKYLK